MANVNAEANSSEAKSAQDTKIIGTIPHRGRPFFTAAQKKYRDEIYSSVVEPMEHDQAKQEVERLKESINDEVLRLHDQYTHSLTNRLASQEIIRNLRDLLVVLKSASRSIELRELHKLKVSSTEPMTMTMGALQHKLELLTSRLAELESTPDLPCKPNPTHAV